MCTDNKTHRGITCLIISLTSLVPFSFNENSSINFTEVQLILYVYPAGSHPRMGVTQLEKVVQDVSLTLKWVMALFQPWRAITSAWTHGPRLLGMIDSPLPSSMQTQTEFVCSLRHPNAPVLTPRVKQKDRSISLVNLVLLLCSKSPKTQWLNKQLLFHTSFVHVEFRSPQLLTSTASSTH